jgi:3-hydroxyisobutyrate dehydrogenase-like beta-hydroxyacid dehydrogenase
MRSCCWEPAASAMRSRAGSWLPGHRARVVPQPRAATVVAAGATLTPNPAEAAADADIVLTTVTGRVALASVIAATGGRALDAMRPYSTWVQMGTISPSWTAEFAGRAAARGIAFVETLRSVATTPPIRARCSSSPLAR